MNSHVLYELDEDESTDFYDSDSNEIIELSNEATFPPWAKLPALATEKIYSFLNREDQSRMSLVCRSWYNEYSSPCLWRWVRFLIPEREYTVEIYPEVQFARKYGDMFHNVEIACKRVRLHLLEVIWKQLKLFLQAVSSRSQLMSIAFINMDRYFRHLDGTIFEDIYQNIMNLLVTQHQLQKVKFQNVQFKKFEAAEVLRAICNKSSKTLTHLLLEGFVNESSHDEFTDNLIDEALTFELLINLKVLIIDYSQIFENIITSCYEYAENSNLNKKKGRLELIKIICDGSKRVNYQGIPPEAWKYFMKVCPSLRIHVIFECGSYIRNTINVFVVRHMPVISLDFRWEKSTARLETDIRSLLQYLVSCRINEFLENLNIVWLGNANNLAPDLNNFLQVCPKLRVLQLYIQHPVEALDTLFISWLENRPTSLEAVHIAISNIQATDDALRYSIMADDYAPLLQVLGLNLLLIADADSNWRPIRRGGM